MPSLMRRAAVAAAAAAVLLGPEAGVASASAAPVLGWAPTTSPGTYNYGTLNAGQAASQVFTLTNSGSKATAALSVTLTGSAAFTKTKDTCSGVKLGTNGSCSVTVSYAPAASNQSDSAKLTATSDKPVATASLTLTGASAKASPVIATSASAGGPVGSTTVADTAILSAGSTPTGTMEFKLYGPSAAANCSGTAVDDETVSVSGNGGYTTPAGAKPAQAGTYWWTASYSGDSRNNQAATACGAESVSISKASPAIATAPSAGGTVGSVVTDTAALAGGDNPTGTIEFKLYGPSATANCSGNPVDDEAVSVSGNGSYTTPAGAKPAQVGTYWWTASYSGDSNNGPAASGCGGESVTIGKASPAIATSPSAGATVGSAVTDTATLSGGFSPGGTVEFKLYGPSATADCSGTPVFDRTVSVSGDGSYTSPSFTPTQAGAYWWTASYSGDAGNNPVASGCNQESVAVSKAAPAIATSPAVSGTGAAGGTTVTDTATLSGGFSPGGTVEFKLYGPSTTANCSGTPVDDETVSVSGNGGYTTPAGAAPAQAGTYWWTASYSGDANNGPAASGCGGESVTIAKATPAMATSPSPGGPAGRMTVTDTATLSGGFSPGGTVEFKLYGPSATANCSGTPVDDETASVSGNGGYTTPAGAAPAQAGTYWWTASYSGDTSNSPALSGCGAESVTMSKAPISIETSPSFGGPAGSTTVTDTATLLGGSSPSGTIEFKLYGPSATANCSGTPVDDEIVSVGGNGSATAAGVTPGQAGTYYWTASYSGDANNSPLPPFCGAESVTIGKAFPAIATTPGPGGPAGSTVTDTATLSGGSSPGGTIEFKLYGPSATANCSGTPVGDKTVSVSGNGGYVTPAGFTPGQAGTYYWTASYSGDASNTPTDSGCGESVTIGKASPAIATAPSQGGIVGTAITDTAALAGGSSPDGTIEFTLYGPGATADCSGTPLFDQTVSVSGDGSYTSPPFTPAQVGTYWWAASYSGDPNNNQAATGCGAESVTISKASPAIATAPSQGGTVGTAVTDTAALAGGDSPTGTIEFTLYGPGATADCSGTPLFDQTVNVSGDGSYTSALFTPAQAGTYWWAASYSGDPNNNQIASGCNQESVTVSKASPAVATTPNANGTGAAGDTTVTDTATLSGGSAPAGTIEFTLYGPSTTANCSTTPVFDQTITVSGDGKYTSPPFTPAQAGTYWWTASYTGDTNNNPATTNCGDESVTIAPSGHLSWTNSTSPGTVNEAGLDGSNPQPIVFNQNSLAGVAVNSSNLYWAANAAIMQAGLDGSNPHAIVFNQNSPTGVAVNSSNLYWAANGAIMEAGLDGSNPRIVVFNQTGVNGVAVNSSNLYWAANGAIMEAGLDGSNPHTIVVNQAVPAGIAVDSSNLYWANAGSGTIMEAGLDGSNPHTIVGNQNGPFGMAMNSSNLYWANHGAGTISEAGLDGSNPHTIVFNQNGAFYVAVGPQ